MRKILIIAVLFLAACGNKNAKPVDTVQVNVPTYVHETPPEFLFSKTIVSPLPRWISPNDKNASSCLTPQGEKQLQNIFIDLDTRIKTWVVYSGDPQQ